MIITTPLGKYQGILEHDVYAFKGIPFAQAPIAEKRFLAPVAIPPHEGVIDATKWQTKAMQHQSVEDDVKASEDCLYLNVWTKNPTGQPKPVVVWVHGGGFTSGTGSDDFLNGQKFVQDDEVVFVTLNYRLGVFGFLDVSPILGPTYKSSANNGILDIIEALTWVKENIASFGGNPEHVTVMGESAGAKCVATLLTIPRARKLIHQVILQSGSVQCIRDVQTAQFVTTEFLKHLPTNPNLLELPATLLFEAQQKISTVSMGQLHLFGPVLDGIVIEDDPFTMISKNKAYSIKVLMGYNKDEASLFLQNNLPLQTQEPDCLEGLFGKNTSYVLAKACVTWEKTLTKYLYKNATLQLAHELTKNGHDVYFYRLDFGKPELGACHAQDLALVFELDVLGDDLHSIPDEAKPLARQVHRCWKNFMCGLAPRKNWPLLRDQSAYMVMDYAFSLDHIQDNEIDWEFPIQVFQK